MKNLIRQTLTIVSILLFSILSTGQSKQNDINLEFEVNSKQLKEVCTTDCNGNSICISTDTEVVTDLLVDFYYNMSPLFIAGHNISCIVEKANTGDENANQYLVILTNIVLKKLEKDIISRDLIFTTYFFRDVLRKWNTSKHLDLYEAFLEFNISDYDFGIVPSDYLSINIMTEMLDLLLMRYEIERFEQIDFYCDSETISDKAYSECQIYQKNDKKISVEFQHCRDEKRSLFKEAIIDLYHEFIKDKTLKPRFNTSF